MFHINRTVVCWTIYGWTAHVHIHDYRVYNLDHGVRYGRVMYPGHSSGLEELLLFRDK